MYIQSYCTDTTNVSLVPRPQPSGQICKLPDFWAGPGDEATQAPCIDKKVTGYHPLLNEGWVGLHTLLQETPVMNKLQLAGVLIVLASYPGCMGGGRRPGNLWKYSGNGRTCTSSRYQAVFLLPRGLGDCAPPTVV